MPRWFVLGSCCTSARSSFGNVRQQVLSYEEVSNMPFAAWQIIARGASCRSIDVVQIISLAVQSELQVCYGRGWR